MFSKIWSNYYIKLNPKEISCRRETFLFTSCHGQQRPPPQIVACTEYRTSPLSYSSRLTFTPPPPHHSVGRVLSFFSSRRNWDSPNPSGSGHTRWRERCCWRVPILARGHTLWCFLYMCTLCPAPSPNFLQLIIPAPFLIILVTSRDD
jgi:hypothetical protein